MIYETLKSQFFTITELNTVNPLLSPPFSNEPGSADHTYLNIDYSCNCVNNKMLESDLFLTVYIYNGNRTEWSPIRSLIIQVINKIGRARSGSLISLITSIVTDRIRRHEVLLPINHNCYNFPESKCIIFSERAFNS